VGWNDDYDRGLKVAIDSLEYFRRFVPSEALPNIREVQFRCGDLDLLSIHLSELDGISQSISGREKLRVAVEVAEWVAVMPQQYHLDDLEDQGLLTDRSEEDFKRVETNKFFAVAKRVQNIMTADVHGRKWVAYPSQYMVEDIEAFADVLTEEEMKMAQDWCTNGIRRNI
jgi:hypothetical protein